MTTKANIISVIETLDDDTSLDEVIDRLYLLRKIELGLAQADTGDVTEHEPFMEELEAEKGRADILTVYHSSQLLRTSGL